MSDFLSSVKADLLDRRLLPLVVLVGVALVAALAYAVFGGGSTAATPTAAVSRGPGTSASVAISQTPPRKGRRRDHERRLSTATRRRAQPVHAPPGNEAQEHHGRREQHARHVDWRIEFQQRGLVEPFAGSGTGSSHGSAAPSPAPSAPATQSKPATPSKPKTVYHVAVLFGVAARRHDGPTAQLTPFENLKLLTPLPSAKQPLLVFRGVTAGGKSATFTLVGEAILHGTAACLPSTTQCQAIDLQRRPDRAARISLADRRGRHLRTAHRQHRLEQGLEPPRSRAPSAASRRPDANCSATPGSTRFPTCATPRSRGVLVFAAGPQPLARIAPRSRAPRALSSPRK